MTVTRKPVAKKAALKKAAPTNVTRKAATAKKVGNRSAITAKAVSKGTTASQPAPKSAAARKATRPTVTDAHRVATSKEPPLVHPATWPPEPTFRSRAAKK